MKFGSIEDSYGSLSFALYEEVAPNKYGLIVEMGEISSIKLSHIRDGFGEKVQFDIGNVCIIADEVRADEGVYFIPLGGGHALAIPSETAGEIGCCDEDECDEDECDEEGCE